jgi:hypothetical protein
MEGTGKAEQRDELNPDPELRRTQEIGVVFNVAHAE